MSEPAPERWLLLQSGKGEAAINMALDAVLLELAPETNSPMLRFYGWTEPAASFGYFQSALEIERLTPCRPLVRRPTGGGLVPHDADWTYSVIIPPTHAWHALRAPESYELMHRWIQRAFTLLDVPVALATEAHKELPGQCFAGYEKSDVLWLGRKMAGAAQRRTRTGLLIQGSVQAPPAGVTRARWESAMLSAARDPCQVHWEDFVVSQSIAERALQLAAKRYARVEYNYRR
jgi:lipoate-protein ligase A